MSIFKVPAITEIIFSTLLEVRIYDVNYGNHLGHDSLISLLHEARIKFLKKYGHSELNINGLGILITNLAVNYVGEAFYADKLTINIGLGEIGRTSIDLIYQAIDNDRNKEIAKAITTVTFYDYQKQKIAKIPQEFLSQLKSSS